MSMAHRFTWLFGLQSLTELKACSPLTLYHSAFFKNSLILIMCLFILLKLTDTVKPSVQYPKANCHWKCFCSFFQSLLILGMFLFNILKLTATENAYVHSPKANWYWECFCLSFLSSLILNMLLLFLLKLTNTENASVNFLKAW